MSTGSRYSAVLVPRSTYPFMNVTPPHWVSEEGMMWPSEAYKGDGGLVGYVAGTVALALSSPVRIAGCGCRICLFTL